MPRMRAKTVADFLEQPHIGVISTLRRNGMPYSVPVWWLHDDGAFWLTGTTSRIWCKQLEHDPRCSLCIEALAPVPGFVAIDGQAEVYKQAEFDIWPISRLLVEKYIGATNKSNPDAVERFFNNMRTEPRLLFRITPEVTRAIDMRVYEGKRADRDYQQNHAANDEQ